MQECTIDENDLSKMLMNFHQYKREGQLTWIPLDWMP